MEIIVTCLGQYLNASAFFYLAIKDTMCQEMFAYALATQRGCKHCVLASLMLSIGVRDLSRRISNGVTFFAKKTL